MGGLASCYGYLHRYVDAARLIESILSDPSSEDTDYDPTELRKMLAFAYMKAGRPGKVVPLIEKEVQEAEAKFGPAHPEVVVALGRLGGCLDEAGRLDEARQVLERALSLPHDQVPQDVIVSALNNLGETYRRLDRTDEAERLLRRSVQLAESLFDPGDAEMANFLNPLALLLVASGRPREAEPLLRRALEITRRVHGPSHPDMPIRLFNLGTTLLELGKLDSAEQLLREAGVQAQIWFSPTDPRIAGIQQELASLAISRALAGPAGPAPSMRNKKTQPNPKKRKKRRLASIHRRPWGCIGV